jgi:hypothetical protein
MLGVVHDEHLCCLGFRLLRDGLQIPADCFCCTRWTAGIARKRNGCVTADVTVL